MSSQLDTNVELSSGTSKETLKYFELLDKRASYIELMYSLDYQALER